MDGEGRVSEGNGSTDKTKFGSGGTNFTEQPTESAVSESGTTSACSEF